MRTSLSIALLALFVTSTLAPAGSGDYKTVNLKIEGMTCEGCVHEVKTSLEKLKGVKKAEVTLAENAAKVTFQPANTNEKALKNAVKDAGFKVTTVSAHGNIDTKEKKSTSRSCGSGSSCCGGTSAKSAI